MEKISVIFIRNSYEKNFNLFEKIKMDIDDFLDREASEVDSQGENKKTVVEVSHSKVDQESLFEGVKSSLSKGKLEEAEQAYIEMWKVLSQQKLNWNNSLYEQLSSLNKQFSSITAQAYSDINVKASRISELISRARTALKEGKRDISFKLYLEIQAISNSIPNVFFEEKIAIQDKIIDFYRELRNTTDSELLKRIGALMHEINQLIGNINLAIKSNNTTSATANYNRCVELFNQIPEGFLKYKNSSGMQLLEIYKSLSIYTEISNLHKQLGQQSLPSFASRMPESYEKPKEIVVTASNPSLQKSPAPTSKQFSQRSSKISTREVLLIEKRERARRNIKKGFYNEAWKDVEEALQIEPNDAEAKALRARIKTLQ